MLLEKSALLTKSSVIFPQKSSVLSASESQTGYLPIAIMWCNQEQSNATNMLSCSSIFKKEHYSPCVITINIVIAFTKIKIWLICPIALCKYVMLQAVFLKNLFGLYEKKIKRFFQKGSHDLIFLECVYFLFTLIYLCVPTCCLWLIHYIKQSHIFKSEQEENINFSNLHSNTCLLCKTEIRLQLWHKSFWCQMCLKPPLVVTYINNVSAKAIIS